MRYVLAVVACLFNVPAQASVVNFTADNLIGGAQQWTLDILNPPPSPDQHETFFIGVTWTGGPVVTGPASIFDPTTYSSSTLFITISGTGLYSERRDLCLPDFHCSRDDSLSAWQGFLLEPQTLNISVQERISGPNAFFSSVELSLAFPDNVILAAPVPELSTWLMMVLGFLGVVLYRKRVTLALEGERS